MKQNLYLFFLFFSLHFFYAQNNSISPKNIDQQLAQFGDKSTSEDDIKKLEQIIKASTEINYKKGIIDGKMKLLFAYATNADYKKILETIKEIEALDPTDNVHLAVLNIDKSIVNKEMGLEKEALQNLRDAIEYSKLIKDPDQRHLKLANCYSRIALYYDYKSPDSLISNLKKQRKEIDQLSEVNPKTKIKKHSLIVQNNINIGNYYVGVVQPMRLDLAEPYYMGAYAYRTTHPEIFEKSAMEILKGVGRFYLEKKEFQKCIEMANEVIAREKINKNPVHRLYGFQLLADSNEELKNSKEQAKYTLMYAKLLDSLNQVAKKEVGKEVDQLITKAKKEKDNEHNSNLKNIFFWIGSFILIITLGIWLYWKDKNKKLKNSYHHLIEKLNDKTHLQQIVVEEISNETEPKTSLKISEETIKSVLAKMEKFEASEKFLKKDITLTWFANYLNVNPKYLSPIIKAHKNNNFNGYINKLRIDYIIRKLYENPVYREYKVSYLAEECGYASPQVFALAFKKETEITPSYFIENLKNNN